MSIITLPPTVLLLASSIVERWISFTLTAFPSRAREFVLPSRTWPSSEPSERGIACCASSPSSRTPVSPRPRCTRFAPGYAKGREKAGQRAIEGEREKQREREGERERQIPRTKRGNEGKTSPRQTGIWFVVNADGFLSRRCFAVMSFLASKVRNCGRTGVLIPNAVA